MEKAKKTGAKKIKKYNTFAGDYLDVFVCSECKKEYEKLFNYCSECGNKLK
jgi:predicted amidophosphoribosyltransferase